MITKPKPIPAAQVALVDDTGKMRTDWYQFFFDLLDRFNKLLVLYGTGATTVAGLPAASTAGAGARAFVTDATATTFHSTVAGTGSNKVPVVSDGTNWLIG